MSSEEAQIECMGSHDCWANFPHCEEGAIVAPTGPLSDWPFHQAAASPARQDPAMQYGYSSDPFLSDNTRGMPDLWDHRTPDTPNPATPPSPHYHNLHRKYDSDPGNLLPSEENPSHYYVPKLLPKSQRQLTMSPPQKLRHEQIRRAQHRSLERGSGPGRHLGPLPQMLQFSTQSLALNTTPPTGFCATSHSGDDCDTPDSHMDDAEGDANSGSEPYAQLIYRALKSVPSHSMVLKDIYEWFEQNTDKTSPTSKGWQNSIRHNLSMNGVRPLSPARVEQYKLTPVQAFNKVDQVPPSEDSKKGFIWVLADSALEEGVKSTTRYRKQNPNKKGTRAENPALQRQISGAKGGKAAKKSAMYACKMSAQKAKRISRVGKGLSSYSKSGTSTSSPSPVTQACEDTLDLERQLQPVSTQHYLHSPSITPLSDVLEPRLFQFSDITACADLGDAPLFYDEPVDTQETTMQASDRLFAPDDSYGSYQYSDAAA